MTTLSPKERTATAVEGALNCVFPQTTFKVEVNDALDPLAVHWHGGPSHDAVNATIARASRGIGFHYSPSNALVGVGTETHNEVVETLSDSIDIADENTK